MNKVFSILTGKAVVIAGKILKRGSSLPGKITLQLNKNIMKEFKLPKTVIAVTGSSGKGSISSMLAEIYRQMGYKVAHNSKGSNLSAGITTLMLENCTITGKIKTDIVIYEIDERYTKEVFKDLKPTHVIISNITRDQPPRQGNVDLVFEEIQKALTDDMELILNADDPYLYKFNLNTSHKTIYYGINKTKYATRKSKFENLNITYCPKCQSRLIYDYYHFESIGNFHCSKCDFKRETLKFEITKLDYDNQEIVINDKYHIHTPYSVLYGIYNTLAVFSTTTHLGLDPDKVINIINNMNSNKKLYDQYQYEDRIVTVLNNKNENSTTFNQSLLFVDRFKETKTIVIGWKEISRRYNFDDLSWLYDIDFELLNNDSIDKVVCVGIHRYDIATRMKYAGIDEKKILIFDNLEKATETIKKKTKGNIYAILNFDYVKPFNTLMNETGDHK